MGHLAVLLVLGGLAGCAPRVQPPTLHEALTAPTPEEQLRRDLRAIFNDPAVDHASWGVSVFSLRHGDIVYSLNAARQLIPASAQKLLTAAIAADRLGWDYRFSTRLYATGPLGADGTLQGDLVVVGNGDPTINPRHPERWRAFDDWAAALAARGIRIVSGRLIGDDRAFEPPGWGAGWAWDDLHLGYGAPVGALQYHENLVEVRIGPGLEPGSRAIIGLSPIGSGLIVDHDVVTAPAGTPASITVSRLPGTIFLRLGGHVAADDEVRVLTASVEQPAKFYLNALREALGRHGIYVAGDAVEIGALRAPPDLGRASLLLSDASAPLEEIVDVMLQWSRNGYAETLLRALAAGASKRVGTEETSSSGLDAGLPRPATADRGLEVLGEGLRAIGLPADTFLARDGSGLSRYNLVSANVLTWLLTYLWSDPAHDARFRATLPVAGVSGTLERRLKDTPAEARVFAKTGSMSNVRALAGYLLTLDNEPMVFTILVNGYRLPAPEIEGLIDRALVRLVEFRRLDASIR